MKKLLLTLFVLINFSYLYAKSLSELSADFKKYQKNYNEEKLISTSNLIVSKLLEGEEYDVAYSFACRLRDATSPALTRYGYYLIAKVNDKAYTTMHEEKYLNEAIINYKASLSSSQESAALVTMKLQALQKKSGLSDTAFNEKVRNLGLETNSDKLLNASYKHIEFGRESIVEGYLDKGLLDVDAQLSSDGTTLLLMAVWFNKKYFVEKLLNEYSADISIRDKEGDDVIAYAKYRGHTELLHYLMLNR